MSDINTTINSFLNDTRLQEVKNYRIDTFEKVYHLEQAFSNLDNIYLSLTGGTLTGNLIINTNDLINNSFSITASGENTTRSFKVGNSLSYLFQTTSNNVTSENKLLIDNTGIILKNLPNEKISLTQTNITIQNRSGSKIENDIQNGYINLYTHSGNYLYFGVSPNANSRYVDWNSGPFQIQSTGSQTQIHHGGSQYMTLGSEIGFYNGNDYAKFFSNNTLLAVYKSGTDSNYFTIGGTNITWRGVQKASYSNPNYDTVDFRIKQHGFDYTGSWYSTQSATNPVQLRIYSGANNHLLYISHSAPNVNNTYISISDETYDTTLSMRCDNGSNYSSVAIGGGNINLNKGFNNSFTHFSAGGGDLETSKDYTGFRFNLTNTSKTKGLTAFKANGVDVDFTIEGFHDIINDKFTLSSTYDTSALSETLTQDEIDWIDANSKDILAMIISLKRSLDNNPEPEPDLPTLSANQLKTKSLDTVEIRIFDQHENNDYTIDWGDGNTSQSGNESSSGSILTHNYSEAGVYIITVTPNNNNATGHFIANNYFTEVNIQDFQFNPALDDYLVKGTFDNQILTSGSGYPYISACTVLEEVHIKENCEAESIVFENCPALTKVVIDAPITNLDYNFFENCPNLAEVHLTSTTMPTFFSGSSLFDIIPDDLVIYVPNDLINDYKTALPDYATYIIGE